MFARDVRQQRQTIKFEFQSANLNPKRETHENKIIKDLGYINPKEYYAKQYHFGISRYINLKMRSHQNHLEETTETTLETKHYAPRTMSPITFTTSRLSKVRAQTAAKYTRDIYIIFSLSALLFLREERHHIFETKKPLLPPIFLLDLEN